MTGEQSDLPDRLPLAHIESTIASVRKMVMMGALFVIVGHLLIIGALGLELTEFHPLLEEFFASLEVAGVGAFEQDMRADGREYATNTYRYEDTARGQAMKTDGFVKVIVDIIGPDAASLIQEVVVAMNAGSGSSGTSETPSTSIRRSPKSSSGRSPAGSAPVTTTTDISTDIARLRHQRVQPAYPEYDVLHPARNE